MSKDNKRESNKASGGLREAIPPIYKVVSGGTTIEFTDRPNDANVAFKEAYATPKFIYSIFGRDVKCVAAAY
jgi:hypothetical protein